ncbi:MAG: hypothetical protein QOI95_4379 [Acidimicrobiaceae bacterium]
MQKADITEQFPQWADLPIRPVALDGWDNTTFRLGEDMSVRLPSRTGARFGWRWDAQGVTDQVIADFRAAANESTSR